jgi:hypothetical protein
MLLHPLHKVVQRSEKLTDNREISKLVVRADETQDVYASHLWHHHILEERESNRE